MTFIGKILYGIIATLTFNSPPLYRYPYRNAFEAFRGDWKRIGGDINGACQSLEQEKDIGEHQ